jgi:protein-S-isoprenylcysteine O-methyltransferase Ste14
MGESTPSPGDKIPVAKRAVLAYAVPKPAERRKRFRPVSIWLMALQLPYFILLALSMPDHERGDPKRIVADSVRIVIFCLPAILAMVFALWELRQARQNWYTSRRSILSSLALLLSTALLALAAIGWCRTLWLDPQGYWP